MHFRKAQTVPFFMFPFARILFFFIFTPTSTQYKSNIKVMRRINYVVLGCIIAVMAVLFSSCGMHNMNSGLWEGQANKGSNTYQKRGILLQDAAHPSLSDRLPANSESESEGFCTLCRGTGRIVKNEPKEVKGADEKVKCKECRKKFRPSEGHSHVTCPLCNGKDVYKYNSH